MDASNESKCIPSDVDIDRASTGSENPLPPVITVFSAPNYCDRYGNR